MNSEYNLTMTNKIKIIIENDECINEIKQKCILWVNNIFKDKITYTKPGSITHLLYGEKPSEQSINIKLGRLGEFMSKELIKTNNNLIDIFVPKNKKVIFRQDN